MDSFLKGLQIVGRHQHSRRVPVPSDLDDFMGSVRLLDQGGEFVFGFTQRDSFHFPILAESLATK